ncbi:D-alanyl-D-alanine carboxypeptidase-like protein [Kribbella voronezhensis]|uniref:D-alanyl-D-alanine carboxypeptidase-like protein n=1 Tax=Kribbella voronezhensis TaxID=2512212 RepID=A0A4R7TAJ7_9ACTN|nr:M15 family metallopeptidase [Kribbella voronezhensis]TDU89060.1 D-alanyl-D-alanine carboxypeptidase-like protein [Kribbella voronezhensis]
MTNELPPRRTNQARTRLLSVTGLVVAGLVIGSLVIWHGRLGDLLDGDSAADKQPVVAGSGAAGNKPPAIETSATLPPASEPTKTPTNPPKTKPTADPTEPVKTTRPVYAEESDLGLTPRMRSRLRKATAAAKADGITISITSARRSVAKQNQLLKAAIAKYGSYREAIRWVLPPDKSAHVKGKAVDIGPRSAMTWLEKNGWRYGLCRRYDNEPWHFEALTTPGKHCPALQVSGAAEAG